MASSFNAQRADSYPEGRYARLAKANLARLSAPIAIAVPASASKPVAAAPVLPVISEESTSKPKVPGNIVRGLTVGDEWSYLAVNDMSNAVVRGYTQKLTGFDASGALVLSDDSEFKDTLYQFMRIMLDPTQPGQQALWDKSVWWGDMKPGDERVFEFKSKIQNTGQTKLAPVDLKVKVVNKGLVNIKIPLGSFQAILLECNGSMSYDAASLYATMREFSYWNSTLWYVPSIHAFVRAIISSRTGSRSGGTIPPTVERIELVAFAVKNSLPVSK
jgi:hypothetical protein